MNFLAHLYLSGDNHKIMVGNFIGDFVKGRNPVGDFDSEIRKGIELHRAIDAFTDSHPVVLKSKIRLRGKYRHYAPVIVDVFYDHFLATQWVHYSNVTLATYAAHSYDTLKSFDAILPLAVKNMLPYMINGNWLVNYGTIEGIHRALAGMSKQSKFNPKMDEAIEELQSGYMGFQSEFETFFPELRKYCENYLK